ncbi:MAG: cysteine synthase family protein [Elusimicrobia bacterium]|nr:cysteine synthase family protein [Elusimicrobiota bacterium]
MPSLLANAGVGHTPIVELTGLRPYLGTRIRLFAKLEWFNPGGSIKDRACWRMIEEAERRLELTPGKTLLDATSGNTGIAYAWIGAAKGYKVSLCVPASINPVRRRILEAFDAELILTDPLDGSDGAIVEARRRFAAEPLRYCYPDQYSNPDNWKAHYDGTGPEIWDQTEGRVTHFVAGLGTSGTFMGVGRRLRELRGDIRLVSVEPDSPFHGLEGLKHMETAIVPAIFDPKLADERLTVSTEEAQEQVRRLARESGILAGVSSGANLLAALRVADALLGRGEEGTIVTVFPDSGERYLGERFWTEGKAP